MFHGLVSAECLKVLERANCDGFIDSSLGKLLNPNVLETSRGVWALILIVSQHLRDEVLGIVGDALPVVAGKAYLACTNGLHDVVVSSAREWRGTAQKDVADNTERPDVALGAVILVKDFRGDVVGSTKFLIKLLVGVVNKRSSEVDDLNLVELLVGLKQNVLRL